ncbi:MAG: hypothetical protein ABIP90_09375 [Vicinamibacterales bacterium]
MKNSRFPARQFGRRFALGAVTLILVLSAADRGVATARSRTAGLFQGSQSNGRRGQAPPARPDDQKSNGPRIPWWKDPVVIKEIRLTPEQAQKVDALWKKREVEMKAAVSEHTKQHDELERLTAERKVGPDVFGLQVDRVEAQRTTLNKSWMVMNYQMSLILSPEQNTALKAYFERNRRNRR